MTTQQDV